MANLSYEDRKAIEKYLANTSPEDAIIYRANSIINQALASDAAGTIISSDNIKDINGITYLNSVISFNEIGLYDVNIQLHLDVISGTNVIVEAWVEYNNGAGWLVYEDSGRFIEFGSRTEGVITYNSDIKILMPMDFRLKARAKVGNIQLLASNLDNGTSAPSVVVSIVKI